VVADRDRDRQRFPTRGRAPTEHGEMMVGRDPGHRAGAAERFDPRDRQVGGAPVGVAGNDRPGGHVRAGLTLEEPRHRQPRQVGIFDDDLLTRWIGHLDRRDGHRQRIEHPLLDPGDGRSERRRDPLAADQ
jgi:hypothetical protein